MSPQTIKVELLPTTVEVAKAITEVFAMEECDFRDITAVALQDPVILANIILLVNESFEEKKRPVVNTLEAAINLVGQPVLQKRLLSIKSLQEISLSSHQEHNFNLIRNRIVMAAGMTHFWADYMGERNIEEQYCASMFTGLGELYAIVNMDAIPEQIGSASYLDSIDQLKNLYPFGDRDIRRLPDSIQQISEHSNCSNRLRLSVLVYELISALELGYSSQEFSDKLQRITVHIDQSESRASNDLASQIVLLNKSLRYGSYNHAGFLLSTNSQAISPIQQVH